MAGSGRGEPSSSLAPSERARRRGSPLARPGHAVADSAFVEDEDDRQRCESGKLPHQLDAVGLGQHEVEQHQRGALALQQPGSPLRIGHSTASANVYVAGSLRGVVRVSPGALALLAPVAEKQAPHRAAKPSTRLRPCDGESGRRGRPAAADGVGVGYWGRPAGRQPVSDAPEICHSFRGGSYRAGGLGEGQ